MDTHQHENHPDDVSMSDATPVHAATTRAHPVVAGNTHPSQPPAAASSSSPPRRRSPRADHHHPHHPTPHHHPHLRQRAQSAPRVRPVIYKSTNLARTAPDLVASASPDVMSSVRAIQKANETAERVRDNFQAEREKQLGLDGAAAAAADEPITGNDEDSNARKYKRRLKLNRQSAAASRVRREAYTKALESEIINMDSTYRKIQHELEQEREENRRLRLYIDTQGGNAAGTSEQPQRQQRDDGRDSGRASGSDSQLNPSNININNNINSNSNNNRNDTTSNLTIDLTQNTRPHQQRELNDNDQKLTNSTQVPTTSPHPELQYTENGSASLPTAMPVPPSSDWPDHVRKKEDVEGCDGPMDDKDEGNGHSVSSPPAPDQLQNNSHSVIPIPSADIGDTNEFIPGPADPLHTPLILSQNASSDVQPHGGSAPGMMAHNNNPHAYPEQGNQTEGGSAVGKSSDFELEHIAYTLDMAPEIVRAMQSPTDELVVDTPDCFLVSDENVIDSPLLGQGHTFY